MRKFLDYEDVIKNVGKKVVSRYGNSYIIEKVIIYNDGNISVHTLCNRYCYIENFLKKYKLLEPGDFKKYTIKLTNFKDVVNLAKPGKKIEVFLPELNEWGHLVKYTVGKDGDTVDVYISSKGTLTYNVENTTIFLSTLPSFKVDEN